jgi:hypothetical protein
MILKCVRGAGATPSPAIYDPLCATVQAAAMRGRVELDLSSGAFPFTLKTVHRAGLIKGDMIEVRDRFTSQHWRGVVQSVSHGIELSDTGIMPVTVIQGLRV